MINLTRLDGRGFTLNADLIELIDSNPDTYIRLLNGNSYLVHESRAEVVERVIDYRRQIFQNATTLEHDALSQSTVASTGAASTGAD